MTHFVSVSLRDPVRVPASEPVSVPLSEPPSAPVNPLAGTSGTAGAASSAPLRVNGTVISRAMIECAIADHAGAPAPEASAKCALVLRALLHQRAAARRLPVRSATHADTEEGGLTEDEALLDQLLDLEAAMPAPTDAECRRYYDAHPRAFRSGDLALARHILFGVTAGVPVQALLARAEATLHEVRADPARFAERAAELSNCPSGKVGGSLGQIGRDDCVPEFAVAVFDTAAPGTEVATPGASTPAGASVLPRLVRTRFGFHIVQVERRIEGVRLPFEMVQGQIARRLVQRVRLKAAQQYVRMLAGAAEIEGIAFDAAASPLMQ